MLFLLVTHSIISSHFSISSPNNTRIFIMWADNDEVSVLKALRSSNSIYIYFNCPSPVIFLINFFIVVQVQLSPFSHHHAPHPTLLRLPPLNLYTYMFLDVPTPIFPHYPSLPLPSDYCQFVPYFNVTGYILHACLFC